MPKSPETTVLASALADVAILCREQLKLKESLVLADKFDWSIGTNQTNTIKYIGGVDISFVKGNEVDACAALVVLSYPDLEVR